MSTKSRNIILETELLVNGYCRIIQKLLNQLEFIIPLSIIELCINLYGFMDIFETVNKGITLSNNGKTATVNGTSKIYCPAYGSIAINSNTKITYKWSLTCNKKKGNCIIGITSKRDINAKYAQIIDYGYGGSEGYKWRLGNCFVYGEEWGTGDTIEMIVDCAKKEIHYKVNGFEQGIAW
eukprot:831092_1